MNNNSVPRTFNKKVSHMLRICGLTLLCGIVLSVLSACGGLNGNPDDFLPTATIPIQIPRRSITQATLPLHEIWRKDIHQIGGDSGSTHISSSDIFIPQLDKLYVVDVNPINTDGTKPLQILALDQGTGEQLWTTNPMWYGYKFTASPEELIIASGDGIVAYDSITGSLKWISDQPKPNHQRYILSYNAPILNFII